MTTSKQWFHYLHTTRNLSVKVIGDAKLRIEGDKLDIPIFDADGNKLFSKYRKAPWVESDEPKYTYEYGAKISLYGVHFPSQHERLFVCEGELDVLALRTLGYDAVSSTGGALSWQKDWVLDRVPTLLFDNDETGIKGAVKTALTLGEVTYSWVPPMFGKDAGEVLSNKGADFLRNIVEDPTRQITINVKNLKLKKDIINAKKELHQLAKQMEESVGKKFVQAVASKLLELERAYKPRKATVDHDATIRERARAYPIHNLLNVGEYGPFRNKAICPFHNEKTPSFHIYKDNTGYCHGQCGRKYDSIDIYMKQNNLHGKDGFKTAINELSRKV